MRIKSLIAFTGFLVLIGTLSASAAMHPAFVEDFEDGDVAGWSWNPQGHNGIIEAVTEPASPTGGNYVGKVTFNGSCQGPLYYFPADPATPDYISWYFRADGDTGHPAGLGLIVAGSSGALAFITYHQGALRYAPEPGWLHIDLAPASTGTWYLIELKNIAWDSNTLDIWVDGVEKIVGVSFYIQGADNINIFINFACPWASGPSYLDDIRFSSAPDSVDDCKKGGWQELADHDGVPFRNQGDCVSYLASGGRNPGDG